MFSTAIIFLNKLHRISDKGSEQRKNINKIITITDNKDENISHISAIYINGRWNIHKNKNHIMSLFWDLHFKHASLLIFLYCNLCKLFNHRFVHRYTVLHAILKKRIALSSCCLIFTKYNYHIFYHYNWAKDISILFP